MKTPHADPTVRYEGVLEHDPRWTWSARVQIVAGRLVVTDLCLRPTRPTDVPETGITSPLLRKVPVARLAEEIRGLARQTARPPARPKKKGGQAEDPLGPEVRALMGALADAGTGKRPRRRDDEHYLTWAVAYAQKLADGSHAPVAEIAQDLGVDRGLVRDRLHIARTRGLLTEVPEGARIGGELTDKARKLLAHKKEA